MAPKKLKLRSGHMKREVKFAAKETAKIITKGGKALKASQKALAKDPKNPAKRKSVEKNKSLLAKAKNIQSDLVKSQKLANMMCPQQVAALFFDFD